MWEIRGKPKLIKLTAEDGRPCYIDPTQVSSIEPFECRWSFDIYGARILMQNGKAHVAREGPTKVSEMVNEARV